MNYLAHLFLADTDPESMVGNLMGDFVKGNVDENLPEKLRQGILLHRKIDVYTDKHPIFKQSRQRISSDFRRYAGILIDIYYDHFLAVHWDLYSNTPLPVFTEFAYEILKDYYDNLPARMQRSVTYMLRNDLLQSYRELSGIHDALKGVEGRLKRPSRLGDAWIELKANYNALDADFSLFFPDLVNYVTAQKRHQP